MQVEKCHYFMVGGYITVIYKLKTHLYDASELFDCQTCVDILQEPTWNWFNLYLSLYLIF